MSNETNLSNNLNYEQFLKVKENILANNSSILNLSNNNLYEFLPFAGLSEMVKEFDAKGFNYHKNQKVHRCHLVENWLDIYSIEHKYKDHIGVSKGVKDTFTLLSSSSEFKYKKWLIPDDVYPFYKKTLDKNFTPIAYYSTLQDDIIPFYYRDKLSENDIFYEADVVLITLPLKPLGSSGYKQGINNLYKLIEQNSDKIFVIDFVYLSPVKNDITNSIVNSSQEDMQYLLELYKLGNVFLLTSLSKAWSMPHVMGITFIPPKFIHFREEFKNIVISEENLKLAYLALNKYTLIPSFISLYFKELRERLDIVWKNTFHYSLFKNLDISKKYFNNIVLQDGYLYYVNIEPEMFLEENILVIPASVFGGTKGSVISILTKELEKIEV